VKKEISFQDHSSSTRSPFLANPSESLNDSGLKKEISFQDHSSPTRRPFLPSLQQEEEVITGKLKLFNSEL
jgi:hypothetical protein